MMKRLLIITLMATKLSAQSLSASVTMYPPTGVDYSGIDAFYSIADLLVKGTEPTLEQWRALLDTPGYQFVSQENQNVRQMLMLALAPSMKAERDAVLKADGDAALNVSHVLRAYEQRDAVLRTRDALRVTIGDSISQAVRLASAFLPAKTTESQPTPFIAFAIFGDDGYSVDGGILLDPLFVTEEGLVRLVAHEFHHAYTATLDRTIRPRFGTPPPPDVGLVMPLIHLRNEGIADLIDKPYPLPPQRGAMASYPARYNAVYSLSVDIIRKVDSLLLGVQANPEMATAAAPQVRALLWSNSHPTGAYMARTIHETFGTDSLFPGLYNPFAFLRAYGSAQVKRGNPPPFSAKSLELIADMEQRYIAK